VIDRISTIEARRIADRRFVMTIEGCAGLCACCAGVTPHNALLMELKRKITGSALAVMGFMLSPLSWWNDAVVNLPLALAFAWLVSALCLPAWKQAVFDVALVVGYWLTNVLGFVLMHKGANQILAREGQPTAKFALKKDLLVSLGYTVLIVALIKFGVLKPIEGYFNRP
jgi:hypothetical protein